MIKIQASEKYLISDDDAKIANNIGLKVQDFIGIQAYDHSKDEDVQLPLNNYTRKCLQFKHNQLNKRKAS